MKRAAEKKSRLETRRAPLTLAGKTHEELFEAVQDGFRGRILHAELFPDFVIEILQELPAGLRHRFVDLKAEFELELIEGGLDLVDLAAALVDIVDALLEIYAAFDGAEHFVAGAENAFEQLELFGQQFVNAPVRGVLAVEEVHDHHIVFLPVAMAAADALFDTLGIPRQVVIHHERAELKVDALRARLRGNHDLSLLAKIVHQRGTHVCGA